VGTAPLTAAAIMDVADAGRAGDPAARGLLLLGAALGEDHGLLDVDLGTRDAVVLEVRRATLGEEVRGHLWCPVCGVQLGVRLTAASLRRAAEGDADVVVESGAWRVVARAPDGHVLAAAARAPGVAAARAVLIAGCVAGAWRDGETAGVDEIPDDVVAVVGEALVARDPMLDVRIGVTCAACSHAWSCCFDAAAFFWIELDALAGRILDEVHSLATAYGWTEAEVLALSSSRRRRYTERLLSA
jgi:hypothetical protein